MKDTFKSDLFRVQKSERSSFKKEIDFPSSVKITMQRDLLGSFKPFRFIGKR